MRYVLYRLRWVEDKGYGPEPIVTENESFLEASAFYTNEANNSVYLGFLTGDLSLEKLSDFDALEISQQEALAFANNIYEGSLLLQRGKIVPPALLLAQS